jgi:hypothetical protein
MPCACGPHLNLRELENHSKSGWWINLKLGENYEGFDEERYPHEYIQDVHVEMVADRFF